MVEKKLKELVSISKGKKMKELDRSDLRYIQIEDLRGDTNLKFCEDIKPFVKCTKDDILIAWDGANAGTIGYNIEGAIGSTIAKLEIKDTNVFPPYLGKFLQSKFKYLRENCTGATIPHISKSVLTGLEVPLPPVETQKRIAGILDDAAALRDKTKQLLKEYDQLAQSIFLEMFGDPVKNPKGWETEKLDNICGVGSSRRVFVKDLVNEGVPFYRGKEIGELSTGKPIAAELFITQDHYKRLAKATGVPKIGDLLMPSICPDGRILRVSDSSPFYFKDGRVLWIEVDELNINGYYLQFLLKALFIANYSNIASGTTFAELKIVALKNLKVLLPPVELQNQFAEKITLIEQQKELAKQELKESEDLFQALLQKAFKGELVKEEELEII